MDCKGNLRKVTGLGCSGKFGVQPDLSSLLKNKDELELRSWAELGPNCLILVSALLLFTEDEGHSPHDASQTCRELCPQV